MGGMRIRIRLINKILNFEIKKLIFLLVVLLLLFVVVLLIVVLFIVVLLLVVVVLLLVVLLVLLVVLFLVVMLSAIPMQSKGISLICCPAQDNSSFCCPDPKPVPEQDWDTHEVHMVRSGSGSTQPCGSGHHWMKPFLKY